MQLQVGRAIPNFYRAEHDPLTNDILIADGYSIADGMATLPEVPGAGITINQEAFADSARIRFEIEG